MAYQRYNINTTPPPFYTSDGFLSSYNPYLSLEPRYQLAGQGPVAPQPQFITAPQQQVITAPQPQVIAAPQPQFITAPQPQVIAAPQPQVITVPQPQVMAAPQPQVIAAPQQAKIEEHVSRGWTFWNIILVILLILSCITMIVNLLDGYIISSVIALVCLCIFYWIYSSYNHYEPEKHT